MRTAQDSRISDHPITDTRLAEFIGTYRVLCLANDEKILSRHNMTMSAVARFLGEMSIIDLLSDDIWRVSLHGTVHCDHAQRDRTGSNALESCSEEERALRVELVEHMFAMPCGLLATYTEVFSDGSQAKLKTASLPLLGDQGERKVVTYALIVQDIPEPYSNRPTLDYLKLETSRYVDLGYGIPESEAPDETRKSRWLERFLLAPRAPGNSGPAVNFQDTGT